jgi:hypothetical protein
MATKNEVAVKSENAMVLAGDFEADASGGFESMQQDDFALPFLRLLTNVSPEIGEIDGAMPGMILNSVTNQLFDGKKGVTVIPCAYVRQYIEWAPRGSGSGAPLSIYPATSDILSRTHREPGDNKDYLDNGNYIENTANHYVMIINDDGIPEAALIVMKSTQLKKSRKWNSMMMSTKMMGKNGPLHSPHVFAGIPPDDAGRVERQGQVVWMGDRAHRPNRRHECLPRSKGVCPADRCRRCQGEA